MKIKIGDVYWLRNYEGIAHPQVIIKIEEEAITVCALTTNTKKATMPGNVILDAGEGNLEKQSIVEVYKNTIINRTELKEFIGSLSQKRVKEILTGIGFINRYFLNQK